MAHQASSTAHDLGCFVARLAGAIFLIVGCGGGTTPKRDAGTPSDGHQMVDARGDAADAGATDGDAADAGATDAADAGATDGGRDVVAESDTADGDGSGFVGDAADSNDSDAAPCPVCIATILRLEAACTPAGICTFDEGDEATWGAATSTEHDCYANGVKIFTTATGTPGANISGITQAFQGSSLCYTTSFTETVTDGGVTTQNFVQMDSSGATIGTEIAVFRGDVQTVNTTSCGGQTYDMAALAGCPTNRAPVGPITCYAGSCM